MIPPPIIQNSNCSVNERNPFIESYNNALAQRKGRAAKAKNKTTNNSNQ